MKFELEPHCKRCGGTLNVVIKESENLFGKTARATITCESNKEHTDEFDIQQILDEKALTSRLGCDC